MQRRNSGLLDGEHGSGRQEMQRGDVIEEDSRNRVHNSLWTPLREGKKKKKEKNLCST